MDANSGKVKEPFVHITKRATIPLWKSIVIRVVAILIAVVISAVLVLVLTQKNPAEVLKAKAILKNCSAIFSANCRIQVCFFFHP